MTQQRPGLALVGALTAAVLVAVLTAAVSGQSGARQTAARPAELTGTWSNAAVVPFERAPEYGNRELLTDAQHKEALAKQLARNGRPGRDSRENNGQDIRGTEKDVARAYNEHFFGDKPTEVGRRTSMIVDPIDGRLPALTPAAMKRIDEKREYLQALLQGTSGGRPGPISPRRAEPSPDYNLDRINRSDGPEDRGGPERCFLNNVPVILQAGPLSPDGRPLGNFGGAIRITRSAAAVNIYYDIGQGSGFNRVIPITNRPHLPSDVRQYWGDSRGHWEGDALVVDVTNFTQETDFYGSRENLHLVERYTRLNSTTLQITTTVEDRTTWVMPFTFVQELRKNADKPNMVYEGGCHEGNYGLLGMLSNTRAAEKAFAEGRGPDPALQDNATGGQTEK